MVPLQHFYIFSFLLNKWFKFLFLKLFVSQKQINFLVLFFIEQFSKINLFNCCIATILHLFHTNKWFMFLCHQHKQILYCCVGALKVLVLFLWYILIYFLVPLEHFLVPPIFTMILFYCSMATFFICSYGTKWL